MQAMHCAFAVGATLGPLLERFVESMKLGVGSHARTELVGVGTYNAAFYIIAAHCGALAVVLLFMESPKQRSSVPQATPASSALESVATDTASVLASDKDRVVDTLEIRLESGAEGGEAAPPHTTSTSSSGDPLACEKWGVVAATATLLGIYVGVETGYGSYVTAFSVLHVGSTEAKGQLLAGAYWGAIMGGRFASIWIASWISAEVFLKGSMAASAVSAVFLLAAGGVGDAPLWLGSIAFGLSMACVYPTTLSLVETFFPILGRHVTCIMIGSATGEMALPAIIAFFFGGTEHEMDLNGEDVVKGGSPMVLMWVLAVFCCINFGLLLVLLRLGKNLKEKGTTVPPLTNTF